MPDRPNLLLITADQLRADALGCYGNPVCRTPNIDRLAAGGVRFEHAYTPDPICVPGRAAITTGNYPHVCTGIKNNGGRIRDDQVKLAEHFAGWGYETYACGKLHYVPYAPPGQPRLLHGFQHCDLNESGRLINQHDPLGTRRGLEDYVDYLADVGWAGYSRAHGVGNNDVRPCPTPLPAEHHPDHWTADRTIARLGEHLAQRADRPFLIWCSFSKPHSPYDPPADYAAMYDPRDVAPPIGGPELLADRNPYVDRLRYTHGFATLSPAALRVIRAYYYGLVSFQDTQIGRVLSALEQAGVADNTIVLYTADHGDLIGDFGSFFKANFFRGSVDVPMIVRGPGLPPGQRRSQLVGLQDVLPTFAALTGCALPRSGQGLDMTPACRDADTPLREVFYGQCYDDPEQTVMLTDGRWKYCHAQHGGVEELYDLQVDPQERVNLASQPGAEKAVKPWRDRLIAEAERLGDTAILDDKGKLKSAPLNREAFKKLPIAGMGWRWF